ncbi:DUF1444 family protein [Terrilactibacillus sp. BCM23-1]|uniref:DUF1444 family protein n=1 Tax=Terrilactibacillus tamarindi TaxID=2599694 RepID=A0A6N8CR62_9BACI|nr:DUF1444 family protein [Terrilactibacillus tamarindi]MTT32531.1 DUF1444 family protein [Terrilactibacillus tamarindi]
MESKKLKRLLENRLQAPDRTMIYDREKETLRIENSQSKKGITLELSGLSGRYEAEKDKLLDQIVYYVDHALRVMNTSQRLAGMEKHIFPVMRSTSFPTETSDGKTLLYKEHTAETRIYYALDLGHSYRLIDREFMKSEGVLEDSLFEMAEFNLRSLSVEMKEDHVADNVFTFINHNDGYDASRILNRTLLDDMAAKSKGDLAVSIPHQDVLIFADIVNKRGYDVLAQMTMQFFTNGNIPITALPFIYEKGKLNPIFILAKNRPVDEED